MAIPNELLHHARELRGRMTDAEQLLWGVLRGRRFCGVKFRRQHPLGPYILDFYCREASLAIELDGGGHNDEQQKEYDEERTKFLNGAGIRVLRFWNHDVLTLTNEVLEAIHAELFFSSAAGAGGGKANDPSPGLRPPSPQGRGEK